MSDDMKHTSQGPSSRILNYMLKINGALDITLIEKCRLTGTPWKVKNGPVEHVESCAILAKDVNMWHGHRRNATLTVTSWATCITLFCFNLCISNGYEGNGLRGCQSSVDGVDGKSPNKVVRPTRGRIILFNAQCYILEKTYCLKPVISLRNANESAIVMQISTIEAVSGCSIAMTYEHHFRRNVTDAEARAACHSRRYTVHAHRFER